MKTKFVIHVFLKEGIADPQARATSETLERQGFDVTDLCLGRVVSFITEHKRDVVEEMCAHLFCNSVMEDFKILQEYPIK